MKKQIALIAALSALTATGAYAGDQTNTFQMLDTNQDGQISAQEAKGHEGLSKHWGELDANSNDQLDQAEFSAFEAGTTSDESEDIMQ